MVSNENGSHLLRELFDVKVNIIIEKAKLKEKSQEYEKLKESFRKISSEIVNIRNSTAKLEQQMKSSRDEEARDEEFFKINSTVQNESSSSIAKSLNTALEDSSNISYETKQKETFNNSDLHLFVGNLSKVTDEESLTKYFSNFGKIVDVHVPKNPDNENRAFGYITFANFFKESPMNQLHKIDGSSVYLDKVRYHNKNTVSDTLLASGKIGEVSTEDLYHHFSKFGKIITINRIRDRSGKFKRNARIIFQSTDEIDQVLKQKEHVVGGQIVDCQRSNRSSNE